MPLYCPVSKFRRFVWCNFGLFCPFLNFFHFRYHPSWDGGPQPYTRMYRFTQQRNFFFFASVPPLIILSIWFAFLTATEIWTILIKVSWLQNHAPKIQWSAHFTGNDQPIILDVDFRLLFFLHIHYTYLHWISSAIFITWSASHVL